MENLLLDGKGNLQVIDFGLSNILPPKHNTNKENFNNKLLGHSPLTTSTTNPGHAHGQNESRNQKPGNSKTSHQKTTSASVESASSAGSPSSSSPYSSNGSHGNAPGKSGNATTQPGAAAAGSSAGKNALGRMLKPNQEQNYGLKSQCGSPAYAAPELLAKKPYNEKVDCWSIGIITYALLTGRLPFTVEPFRIQALYRKMVSGDMNSIPSHISSKCKNFIFKLLTPDPESRPSAAEMSKHEWLHENTHGLNYSNSCHSMKNAIKNHFLSNSCLSSDSLPQGQESKNMGQKSNSNSILRAVFEVQENALKKTSFWLALEHLITAPFQPARATPPTQSRTK